MALLRNLRCFSTIKNWNFYQKRHQQTQTKPLITTDQYTIFGNINLNSDRIAIQDRIGRYSYANLFKSAKLLSSDILKKIHSKEQGRVLFLCDNEADYVITLWAIWMAGHIAVPLNSKHPKNLLLYYANDTNANLFITTQKYSELINKIAKTTNTALHVLDDKLQLNTIQMETLKSDDTLTTPLPLSFYTNNDALILYTSGTTGSPKGVVLTHNNLNYQMNTLIEAWKWSNDDCILHTLPLNHVHGIVNALLCPLAIGAQVELLPKFDSNTVWKYLLGIDIKSENIKKINVYMAVPTIYSKLIESYENLFSQDAKMVTYIRQYLKTKIRLMVSGSAPLPAPIFEKWLEISGHQLLERYGMTETGMILSNNYNGEREPGYVGLPLPGVTIKLAENIDDNNYQTLLSCSNQNNQITTDQSNTITGDLLVKSNGLFRTYYKRNTKNDFTNDGYFKTGDVCLYDGVKQKFQILGRKSADIIKSGGYKISALQIETAILSNPEIRECVVVGVPDDQYGEKIVAIVVKSNIDELITLERINDYLKKLIPKYSLPRQLEIVDNIPRNTMGKVNKREIIKKMFN